MPALLRFTLVGLADLSLMGEHVINFVEGDGISIQAGQSVDAEMWDVEIASTVIPAAPFDPSAATQWWMPLVDSDGVCVLDSTGDLIPTLITI